MYVELKCSVIRESKHQNQIAPLPLQGPPLKISKKCQKAKKQTCNFYQINILAST